MTDATIDAPGEWAVPWATEWGLRGRWVYVPAPCPGAVRLADLPPGAVILGWPIVGIPAGDGADR